MPLALWLTLASGLSGLIAGTQGAGGSSERVLGCQANDDPYASAGARLRNLSFFTGSDYTACIRFQLARLTRANIVFTIDSSIKRPLLQLDVRVEKLRVTVSYQYKFFVLDSWLRLHHWYQVCITHDSRLNFITTFLDGRPIGNSSLVATIPARATSLTVGFIDHTRYPGISLIGNVTHFNIWDHILTSEDLAKLAMCAEFVEGNIVSWGEEWEVKNVVEYTDELENLCYRIPPLGFQVFKPMTYSEGSFLCEALGGVLNTPATLEEAARTFTMVQGFRSDCTLLWTGVTDQEKEGQWTHHNNKSLAGVLPWAFDEPNGLSFENCGGMDGKGVIDEACTSKRCPVCSVEAKVSFTLLGSCEEFVHNMNYLMTHDGDIRFIGYGDYLIYYDGSRWLWVNHIANLSIAEMVPARYDYPVGRQLWLLHKPVCQHERDTVIPLLLTVCRDGFFTCDDGTCVPLHRRCNLRYDCRDYSDEAECHLVRLPLDYKSTVAPRPTGDELEPLMVVTEATVETIQVDTPGMFLKVGFNLSLSWMESRATFFNLKHDLGLNQIDRNQTELWYPAVTFLNTIENEVTVVDQHTRTNVLRYSGPRQTDPSLAQEVLLYPGWGNPLVTYRKYVFSFTCDFDLTRYPFDRQNCYLLLQLSSASRDNIRWDESASWVKYEGSQLLLEYSVGRVTILHQYNSTTTTGSTGGEHTSLLKVHVPLSRRIGYAVINIYLPSCIMAIVGYLTLYFVKQNFEVRVMTALTSLLVLATISNQVSSSLPKSSSFKLVDVWLFFCIFSTFLIIVFHIVIDLVRHAENNQQTGDQVGSVTDVHRWVGDRPGSNGHKKQQGRRRTPLLGVCGNLVDKIKEKESGVSNLASYGRCMKNKRCRKPQLTVLGVDMFARIFMAAVFVVFNICYWHTAYSGE